MAGRPPTPLGKALVEGRADMNPGRYKDRTEIDAGLGELGDAPPWITNKEDCHQLDAWNLFRSEAPWLKSSHRVLVGLASQLQGFMMAGSPLDVKELVALKGFLSALGMTPIDAGKVMAPAAPSDEEKEADPTEGRKRR